jgi:hypothetical protein
MGFHVQEPHIGGDRTSAGFAIYSTFLTVGIVLMLLYIPWLEFIGVAFVIVSSFFSVRFHATKRYINALFICFVAAFWCVLTRPITHTAPSVLPLWYVIFLLGAWLWSVAREYTFLRKAKKSD